MTTVETDVKIKERIHPATNAIETNKPMTAKYTVIEMKQMTLSDSKDPLIETPNFWDGIHGIKAFKIICICLIISSILNMTLWIRLAEYREVIILFPLSDIFCYMKLQHMNFFIMIVLFGLTIFGVYLTLENITNISDNVSILRIVSIVIILCPIFGFRTPFWLLSFIPFYGQLDSSIYKYLNKNKDNKIALLAIHHYIVDTLSKHREKENNYIDAIIWKRMEYQSINEYLNNKLQQNDIGYLTEIDDILAWIYSKFKWKSFLLKMLLCFYVFGTEISLFRILYLKNIIFNLNDYLFLYYCIGLLFNIIFAICTLLWCNYNEMNKIYRNRILSVAQRYNWSEGYELLIMDEFTKSYFIKEFDIFYLQWSKSYWIRDVKEILLHQCVYDDILSVIFEYI